MKFELFWYDFKINKWSKTKSYRDNYSSFLNFSSENVVIDLYVFYDIYKRNADIRQSSNKIAITVSKNWLLIYDNKKNLIDNPLINLEILSIFSLPTFLSFKKEFYKQYLISWEVYIIATKDIRWKNNWLQILDSRTMSKIVDNKWNFTWFKQYNTFKSKYYSRDDVCYFQLEKDTDNENKWMWLLNWVIWDALSDLQSSKRNYRFFENDAIPGAMLMLDETLSNEEMKIAKEQFERQYKWTNNSHKMLIAWWIKDIKILSISHKDMDFINQKKLTTEKISSAFWVPKTILWYVDNVNLANAKELKVEYIEWTIRPYEKDFDFILNSILRKFYTDIFNKYKVKTNWETLEDTQLKEDNQRKDLTLWLKTIDEIRIERNLDEFKLEETKNPIILNNIIPITEMWMDPTINLWE